MKLLDTLPKAYRTKVSKELSVRSPSFSERAALTTQIACAYLDTLYFEVLESQVDQDALWEYWDLCTSERFVPIRRWGLILIIACGNPWDEGMIRRIRRKTRMQIETVGTSMLKVDRVFAEIGPPKDEAVSEVKVTEESFSNVRWDVNINAMRLAEFVIKTAYDQKASDIHLEPWPDRLVIRFRIHGSLETMPPLPLRRGAELVAAFKSKANLPEGETESCASSRIDVDIPGQSLISLRLEKQPGQFGEAVVCRLLDDRQIKAEKGSLPFSAEGSALVKSILNKSAGMFVVTGPTGSGKTTTNSLCIASMDTTSRKFLSAEDPIEYVMPGVQQVQIGKGGDSGGPSFADVLRSNLRCDPEVLIVGEIRDPVTAEISSRSVQTGHLVMATLHTNDCIGVIPRLIGLGVSPVLVSQILSLVVSQRLCYRLCDECKTSVVPSPAIIEHFNYYKMPVPKTIFEKCGCKQCNGIGTVGRLPIFEMLHLTKQLKSQIASSFDEIAFREAWRDEGGVSLVEDGLKRVAEGLTSYSEVGKYDEYFIPKY